MKHIENYLREALELAGKLDRGAILDLVEELAALRERGGRLFVLGVGGSAAAASHAVNDFRKLCSIEAYAPADNVSELTARANDEGWASVFRGWLEVSRLGEGDAVLVFSVGGGSRAKGISVNLVEAVEYARQKGARVLGVVGRDGGETAKFSHACLVVPPLFPERVTPHTEAFLSVVAHLLVSHPRLQAAPAKWESAR